jgi:hypothetical protein
MRRIMPQPIDITALVASFGLSTHHYYPLSSSRDTTLTAGMEKQYICPRCNQEIISSNKSEHDDWHFAEDLDRAEGAPSSPSIHPPTMSDRKHSSPSPTKQKPSWIQPVDSHHQSATNSAHATKRNHHVPHVNAVDKAANLRAQTEVCIIYTSSNLANSSTF